METATNESASAASAKHAYAEPTHFTPDVPIRPETFDDSKARIALQEQMQLEHQKGISERELEKQTGGVKVWHEGRFVPYQEPPPKAPEPNPGKGVDAPFKLASELGSIKNRERENALNRYCEILRDGNEKLAPELRQVTDLLGFNHARVVEDVNKIKDAVELIRQCLRIESEGSANYAQLDAELNAFKEETDRIIKDREQQLARLNRACTEAWSRTRSYDSLRERMNLLIDSNPTLLRPVRIKELDAATTATKPASAEPHAATPN